MKKAKIISKYLVYIVVIFTIPLSGCQTKTVDVPVYSDPVMPLIQLPVNFKTYRQNSNRGSIEAGSYYDILNVKGPGCVRSIWLLRAEDKRFEIIADGAAIPQVDMPAATFFGILLGKDPYFINSAPMVSMPNEIVKKEFKEIGRGMPGYTSYLPIPFQDSCRIRVYADKKGGLAAMVNWHKYADGVQIIPYRLNVTHNVMNPAPPRGKSMLMADVSGSGFIAGIFQGVIQLSFDDLMYHQGGITWLIDGETDPHAIRGHNMEDDYGFTWGFHTKQTQWFGVPYHDYASFGDQEAVVYRFMGPDPVSFQSSISMRVGTRPDHTETLVYYYKKQGKRAPEVTTPLKWQVTGTFPCKTKTDFEDEELPEELKGSWKDSIKIGDQSFIVHELESDHTWVNFHRIYFTPKWTPFALTEQSAYAKGIIEYDRDKKATIRVSFDDWITIWLNGKKLVTLYHEENFKPAEIPVNLRKGNNEILLKYANFDKLPNNRLWAFSLVLK